MNIAILGCGWLGFPLAIRLLQAGHKVEGSTTSVMKLQELSEEGIGPHLIKVTSSGIEGDLDTFLSEVRILIIDVPPAGKKEKEFDFIGSMKQLIKALERFTLQEVLLVSSISVYGDWEDFPEYSEDSTSEELTDRGQKQKAAERLFRETTAFRTSVLRLGGLIGPDRHPIHQLAGRKELPNPQAPVNLVHQKDCIEIITRIIEKEAFGEVYNVVFPSHPNKEDYYTRKAQEAGLEAPQFSKEASKGKIVSSLEGSGPIGVFF